MSQSSAADAVGDIDRLRQSTRADLKALWFPLILFGSAMLASTVVIAQLGVEWLGAYWGVVGPLGGAVTGLFYSRREQRLGVEGPALPYVATGIALMVGCFGVVAAGLAVDNEALVAAGPYIVISLGYLSYAWLERSLLVAVVAAGLGMVTIVLAASELSTDNMTLTLAATYGFVFLGTGLMFRLRGATLR